MTIEQANDNGGYRQIEIVGPLLAEEGMAVLAGHSFGNKAERRQAAIRRGLGQNLLSEHPE